VRGDVSERFLLMQMLAQPEAGYIDFPKVSAWLLSAMALGETHKALRPARVLIVEDEYFVALEAEQCLEDAGFTVVGVADTAELAVQLALSGQPEIVVMDIRLSGPRDGVDAAIELRSLLDIPCVFATAHADTSTRRRAEKAKAFAWLQKPYSSNALIDVLNRALSRSA
jgi:CheY-like chemotaxis protein